MYSQKTCCEVEISRLKSLELREKDRNQLSSVKKTHLKTENTNVTSRLHYDSLSKLI